MAFIVAGFIFGLGMTIAHMVHSRNRKIVIVIMGLTAIAAGVVASQGSTSPLERLSTFGVTVTAIVLGYYGSAKLLYGDDYWLRKDQ